MRLFSLFWLLSISTVSFGQSRVVKGVVKGHGETLPGVNVIIKGTRIGTTTDLKGRFELEIPGDTAVTLYFSFIGPYAEKIVKPKDTFIKVKMDAGEGPHNIYLLGSPGLFKVPQSDFDFQYQLGIGYRYSKYKFGIGAEILYANNSIQGEKYGQLGIPLLLHYEITYRINAELGGGYFWSLNNQIPDDDFKALIGVTYDRRKWELGIRYQIGTQEIIPDQLGRTQNLYLTARFRLNY